MPTPAAASRDRTAVGALAWAERGTWDPDQIAAQAVPVSGGTWRITGTEEYVLDGADAELLLVAAQTPAGLSLFEVAVTRPAFAVSRPWRWTRPAPDTRGTRWS